MLCELHIYFSNIHYESSLGYSGLCPILLFLCGYRIVQNVNANAAKCSNSLSDYGVEFSEMDTQFIFNLFFSD